MPGTQTIIKGPNSRLTVDPVWSQEFFRQELLNRFEFSVAVDVRVWCVRHDLRTGYHVNHSNFNYSSVNQINALSNLLWKSMGD